jgi:hypothetical protein
MCVYTRERKNGAQTLTPPLHRFKLNLVKITKGLEFRNLPPHSARKTYILVTCEATHPLMQSKVQSIQNFTRAIDRVNSTARRRKNLVMIMVFAIA